MHRLAALSIRRPVLSAVLILGMVFLGVFAYLQLDVDRWPNVDVPIVGVTVILPGASPEEIETDVTNKIEDAINTLSGIDHITSTSAEGVSIVVVQFFLEKDIEVATREVQDKITTIPDLPAGIDPPIVSKVDPSAQPVITLAVSADRSVRDISEYADKVLKPRLEGISGVGQVRLIGDQARQINVWVNPDRLAAYGLPATAVLHAIQDQNLQLPAGHVDRGSQRLTLRALGRVRTPAELEDLGIATRDGQPLTLGDVARVEDGAAEQVTTATLNGAPAVLLQIQKQSGANTLNVARSIKARLRLLRPALPPGYDLKLVRDQSVFVEAYTRGVEEHLLAGSLLAALVVLVFLGDWRSTAIAALAIPTSLVSTFALIAALGMTLNTVTLLALALVVGIVIDDAMVVLENIYRLLHVHEMPPRQAAIEGTREIGPAVTATTLSLIAVFLPLAFMGGIVGRFMRSFGWTMAFAIAVSWIVSFTLTPSLCARWLGRSVPTPGRLLAGNHERDRVYRALDHGYRWLLERALRRRWVVSALTVVTLVSIVPLGAAVGKNFLPEDDASQFEVVVREPEEWTLSATERFGSRLAAEIRHLPGIDYTIVTAGDDPQHTPNRLTIFVRMTDLNQRRISQRDAMAQVRTTVLPRYAYLGLQTQVGPVPDFGGSGGFQPVDYVIRGPDLGVLSRAAEAGQRVLRGIPGAVDVRSSLTGGTPQMGFQVNRTFAADLGVDARDVANTLSMLVQGIEAKGAKYAEGGQQYRIYLRADAAHRSDTALLSRLPVGSSAQGLVMLEQVVDAQPGMGPGEINHYNRQRQVRLTANLLPGTSQAAVLQELDSRIRAFRLGSEYTTDFSGQAAEQGRQSRAFAQAFLLSFVFMYLVLAAQFESWIHPVTILLSLPLTVPFALASILLLHGSLNILSQLGILVLFGVVKKNAILQIDRANQLREAGAARDAAIVAASGDRLRPILMTTIAFVAGMIPLALSSGVGAATNHAMSTVIIGGQTLSLLLTLVAIPVMYSLFDDLRILRAPGWMIARVRAWRFGAGALEWVHHVKKSDTSPSSGASGFGPDCEGAVPGVSRSRQHTGG